MKVAILDDYQNAALSMADWSRVSERAEITVFTDHLVDADAVVERLRPFDVVCVMRERTPLSRAIIERLPRRRRAQSRGLTSFTILRRAKAIGSRHHNEHGLSPSRARLAGRVVDC